MEAPTIIHLQPGEELVGVLVLSHIHGLPVVVLEGIPELLRPVARAAAEEEVREHGLQANDADTCGWLASESAEPYTPD